MSLTPDAWGRICEVMADDDADWKVDPLRSFWSMFISPDDEIAELYRMYRYVRPE